MTPLPEQRGKKAQGKKSKMHCLIQKNQTEHIYDPAFLVTNIFMQLEAIQQFIMQTKHLFSYQKFRGG